MNTNALHALLAAAALAASLGLAGPAAAARVYVRVAPPAVRMEVRGVTPSPHHAWHDGYWRWHDGAHVWVAGAWVVPPRHGAVWVGGHWKKTPSGWYWIDGRWR